MKKYLFVIILIFATQLVFSDDISIETYVDKTKIGIQEYLKYTIEISGEKAGDVKPPELPDIDNFKSLGTSSSSSSSYSIINGRMTAEITKSYTYTLQPRKTGTFIIPPITIKYKKQVFTTDPIRIKVIKGSTEPAPPPSNRFKERDAQESTNLSDNLLLLARVDKRNVYKNEPIIVNYKLYSRYDIANLSFSSEPSFNGFWKEDIFLPENINFQREKYDGRMFNVMLMRSTALFPTSTGRLEIPSLELQVDIRTQSYSFFDFGSTKRYTIRSKPIAINIKELPIENRPINFSDAVGSYRISSTTSQTDIKVGDSFTYTLKISGSGNLKQFDPPILPEIQNLRFIDPEVSTKINKDKISGTKTIKYLVIAQEKGEFIIPSISFSYFDTSQKKYITKNTRSYNINVQEGDVTFIPSSTAQSIVEMEGSDIGFIITDTQMRTSIVYLDRFGYWLIWVILLMLIPASMVYSNEQRKLAYNIDYLRQKQANKILKKYMKQASEHVIKVDIDFYLAAQVGLSSYLADKLKIPRGSSTEQLLSEIGKGEIPDETMDKIKNIFEKCNQARFMPGGFSKENIDNDYKLLKEIVSDISKMKI
ncbi:MAG: protein BatD [Candidatus Cloacimonetes bacterium]|nr:protein BatD [Candidatus Cloacimonadota bacterium]